VNFSTGIPTKIRGVKKSSSSFQRLE